MQIRIDTNLGELSAFLGGVLSAHRSKATSAFRIPSVKWKLTLFNDAYTETADGKRFYYYASVDTGRREVHAKRGGWLIFGSPSRPTFAKSVRASTPLLITDRSLGAIHATYNSELSAALDQLSTRRSSTKDFSVSEFFRAGNSAAARARVAGSKAPRFRVGTDNTFFKLLVKLPNWASVAGAFEKVTEDQLKVFRRNTPRRKLHGKLHYIGGGEVEAVPTPTGQHLRDGYKLNRDKAIQAILGSQKSSS